jgi:hypothetical protein
LFQFLLRHERDSEIEARNMKGWLFRESLLEVFLRVARALLIHVRHTQRVEAQRLLVSRHWRSF